MDSAEGVEGNCPSEAFDTDTIIRTVRTLLVNSIALNNSEGFTMALEALEELRIGLNWSFHSKSAVYGGDGWNTPLTLSAKLGRTSMVTTLLQKGADPNFVSYFERKSSTGRTALHEACKSGRAQVVECLLTHGCNVNVSDTRGWTPIHHAICHGKTDIAFLLLENGADPRNSLSVSSSEVKNLDVIGGASLMFSTSPYRLEPFMPSSFEWNCLSLAANCHQPQLVAKLIQEYFQDDVDCQSPSGRTALHEAVTLPENLNLNEDIIVQSRHETIKVLLNAGINPNIPDHTGKTALHLFFDHVNVYKIIVRRYSKIVLETICLLCDYGADLNAADFNGRTVVHQAAAFGNVQTMQILLELGVGVTSLDNDGNTPAHVAAYHGNLEVLQCLLARVPHAELVNRHGDTVLHVAIMTSTDEVALVKIAQSLQSEPFADEMRRNVYGETEHDLAVKFKLERLARLLSCQTNESDDTDSTPGGTAGNAKVQHSRDCDDLSGEDNRSSDTGASGLKAKHDWNFKLGDEYDSQGCYDEVPELLIDDDTDVNEYLLKLCREYRVSATGRIGEALTRQLLLSPLCQEVHAVTRRKIIAFDELSASAKLKQHFADFGTDLCGLNGSALQGIDAAFCVLGSRSGWSDEKEMAAVDRDAVMRFLRLCQEANVPHVTVLSSAWANTSSVFPFARLQGETIEAISAMKTFSRTSIFQPSAVTGADGRLLSGGSSFLGNLMWQSLPVASQFMPKVYRPIAMEDLALAMRLNVELCDASEAVEKLDYRGMMMIIGKDADL